MCIEALIISENEVSCTLNAFLSRLMAQSYGQFPGGDFKISVNGKVSKDLLYCAPTFSPESKTRRPDGIVFRFYFYSGFFTSSYPLQEAEVDKIKEFIVKALNWSGFLQRSSI